jgi:hypothetical protein
MGIAGGEMTNHWIKKMVHQHKKLLYAQRCFKNLRRNDFVEDVLDVQINPMVIKFETLGEKNKEINLCLYENRDNLGGFFAVFRYTLNALYFAERFHFTPVINYTSEFIYAEKEEVNGTTNPFEYYFEPVSKITLQEAYSSFNVARFRTVHNRLAEELNGIWGYQVLDSYINAMGGIERKYIRLNSYVRPVIEENLNTILQGKKTLGIHVRGADFNMGFNYHPKIVKPMEYVTYIKEAIAEYGFEQIFIATDDNNALKYLKDVFGDKLVYYQETVRADDMRSVTLSNLDRQQHHYLLGLEVLRDMYTLANCDGLIADLSHVSICARITKASYERDYVYFKIMDNGIHKNHFDVTEYGKKLVKSNFHNRV